jgi:hypothetical protein
MQVAQEYASDLQQRIPNFTGDPFRNSREMDISTLLREIGYPSYSNGYKVDFVPIIVRNVSPTEIVDYWIADANGERQILSLRISQGGEQFLPIFSPAYREIGIGYQQDVDSGRYFYVFVFASQPQVLPIIVAARPNLYEISTTVSTPNIFVFIPNENVRPFGEGDIIGAVRYMHISEVPEQLPCPTQASEDWDIYANENEFQLSDGYGLKTIYVQLCDNSNRTVLSSAQVYYVDPNIAVEVTPGGSFPTPDVLRIANITQTAAAVATAYEPYRPTIEAILTATGVPNNRPNP